MRQIRRHWRHSYQTCNWGKKLLLDSGGFKLTKFSSNSKKVLLSLSPDELAPGLKDGIFRQGKALGVYWNTEKYEFGSSRQLAWETCHSQRGTVSGESVIWPFWNDTTFYSSDLKVYCRNCASWALVGMKWFPLISKNFGCGGFKHCRNVKRFRSHDGSEFAETIRSWRSCTASVMLQWC